MSNKNTIRKFIPFEYTDLAALREYFEDMSSQGWFVTNIRGLVEFKKSMPCRLRYNVVILPTASQMNNKIDAKSLEYIEMCREAGWIFITNTSNVYVFVAENPNVPDIVTDRHETVEAVRRSGQKRLLLLWALIPVLALNLLTMLSMYRTDFSYRFPLTMLIGYGLIIIFFIALIFAKTLSFMSWSRQAKSALKSGKPIPEYDVSILKRRRLTSFLIVGLVALIIAAWIISCINQRQFMIAGIIGFWIVMVIAIMGLIFWMPSQKMKVWEIILITAGVMIGVMILFIVFLVLFSSLL